jgi:hypothetical protein
MAYVPPNRIKTNLYTPGKEFIRADNGDEFIGSYWKNFQDRYFIGKTPNDGEGVEIIKSTETDVPMEAHFDRIKFSYIADNADEPGDAYENRLDYIDLKQAEPNKIKLLPVQYYPTPTEEEYKLGVMQRYFSVKQNENLFLEIDKRTSNNLARHNNEWDWETYATFRIQWVIKGKEEDVFNANLSSVGLKEKDLAIFLRRGGFSQFLRGEYLKFWMGEVKENLNTKGGEYLLPNGKEYMGPYHIHPSKGAMVGATHISSPHSKLTPIKKDIKVSPTGSTKLMKPKKEKPTTFYQAGGSIGGGGY